MFHLIKVRIIHLSNIYEILMYYYNTDTDMTVSTERHTQNIETKIEKAFSFVYFSLIV